MHRSASSVPFAKEPGKIKKAFSTGLSERLKVINVPIARRMKKYTGKRHMNRKKQIE